MRLMTVLALSVIAASAQRNVANEQRTVKVAISYFHSVLMRTSVRPHYPAEAISKKKEGVAVAAIALDTRGNLEFCRILQAPDKAIGTALEQAVSRWTFNPMIVRGQPVRVLSKVIFYFKIVGGMGIVVDPIAESRSGETLYSAPTGRQ